MRWTAKKTLKQVLHQEELHIKNVINEPLVGDRLGLSIAGLATRLSAIEKKFSQKEKIRVCKCS